MEDEPFIIKINRSISSDRFKSGQINFKGIHNTQPVKYSIIEHTANVEDVARYLIENNWGIKSPNLIISVTGGAQNFTLPSRVKTEFQSGIIKLAESTNSCIITTGYLSFKYFIWKILKFQKLNYKVELMLV